MVFLAQHALFSELHHGQGIHHRTVKAVAVAAVWLYVHSGGESLGHQAGGQQGGEDGGRRQRQKACA